MTRKSLLTLCVFLFASLAGASDYDLIVPSGWDYLKAAKTLVVYAPGGTLKAGDHISRVVPGGAQGPGVKVSAGWPGGNGVELAKAGSVDGFLGGIVLSPDNTGSNGLSAVLVPAGQGASAPPEDGIRQTAPWVWVVVGVGILLVLGTSGTLFRRSLAPASPLRFTGRKGVEQGVREIRAKMDEIQAEQQQLVRKPPVLRSFRKQIENFERKLEDLDSSSAQTRQQLAAIAGSLQKLDERLNTIAQHSVSASSDSKKAIELVQKASAEQATRSAELESQLKRSQEALASQLQTSDARLQATGESLDATRSQLEKLDAKVQSSAQSAQAAQQHASAAEEATRKEIAGLAGSLEGTGKRLAALEAELGQSARRDEATSQSLADALLAAKVLEQSVQRLEGKFDTLSKSVDTVQMYVHEVHGRLSNTEGSLHANFQDLATELGTLRNEVGSLPKVMNTLGDRVGSLDARLAPLSERGDKLAETLQALQARFEETSSRLSTKVDSLSTDTGLKNLGDELAKIQEALVNDSKQSDSLADELAQRLEAWEGALAHVASKVEDLAAADEIEAEEQPRAKKGKSRAAKAQPVAEEEPVTVAAEPAYEPVAEEEPAPVEEPAPEPVVEPVAVEAEAVELEIEPVLDAPVIEVTLTPEEEDESELVLAKSKVGRWTELGGSSERLWSIKLPGAPVLPDVKGPVRPMTPIETPGIDSQIGALICTGQGTAYVHGEKIRSFWPGTESRSAQLMSPMPNDLWRLMMFGGYMYCAAERQVEIIHLSTWTRHAFFQGDYLGQAHTDSHWVGVMAWGERLAVDFRDALGNHIISPREMDASAAEQFHLAASGSSAYLGTRSGSIFRVQTAETLQICRSSEEERLLSLSLTKQGILAMIQGENGVSAKLLGPEGHLLKTADLGCQVMAHAPVVMGGSFYVFDDCLQELVTVNLQSLQVTARLSIESVLGVSRMVGLACGNNPMLAMLSTDDRGQPSRAFLVDANSGREMTLCQLNHPRAELVAGDGHLVITTSSAYQNTIQVFDPFEAVELKGKRAA